MSKHLGPNVPLVAQLFRVLGDENRLRIVALLSRGELCVCHIEEALDLPQPTVSRHLKTLRDAGVVQARRGGTWIYYSIATELPPELSAYVQVLAEQLARPAARWRRGCQ